MAKGCLTVQGPGIGDDSNCCFKDAAASLHEGGIWTSVWLSRIYLWRVRLSVPSYAQQLFRHITGCSLILTALRSIRFVVCESAPLTIPFISCQRSFRYAIVAHLIGEGLRR